MGKHSRMKVLASFLLASSFVYTVRSLSEDELLLLSPEELCRDRLSEEYFRLKADYDGGDCRDVVRCDRAGAAGTIRLAAVRCPAGLAFDIYRQTCDWKAKVTNCDELSKPRKALPNLRTDEPVCPQDELQCGNGQCIPKALFCDEQVDCQDGSDENACGVDQDPNRAADCDTSVCQLPDCFCSPDGTRIPGDINADQVPQMITITKQFEMMADQFFVYDASITAPLARVPQWPYTLYYRMPHKCHGNAGKCPSRAHPIWEMVINELDRRDDP